MPPTSYTLGHDRSTLQSHQSRRAEIQADYLIPHIQPTSSILDVGCGPGTITCGFAKYAPQGRVVGVDSGAEVIEQARSEAKQKDCEDVVTFQVGTAHDLPFEDDTFDIVHCHALLIHLPDAAGALREMRRVCKTGGYVAAREPDWDTCVIHPHNPVLEKWKALQAQLKRKEGAEPNAGRRLGEWALSVGFEVDEVQISSNVLQYVGREELGWWGQLSAARAGTEVGKRAVRAEMATQEEMEGVGEAWREWSRCDGGIWAMMHMRLLGRK